MSHADEYSLGDWLAENQMPDTPEELLRCLREANRKVVVYPGSDPGRDFVGNGILPMHVKDFRPDMFWTSGDVWPFVETAKLAQRGLFVWGVWAFVDFDWENPVGILDHLAAAAMVVPTSVWLERRFRAIPGLNVSPPVHLGVNTDSFRPLLGEKDDVDGEITQGRLRRSMGLPEDCFQVTIVQMNQIERKPFEEQLEGVRLFRDANPDVKLKLYLHTFPHSAQGYDLPALLREMKLEQESYFADPYRWLKGVLGYSDSAMCKIYNCTDVLLQASAGESPGMPLLEAQSCGCPVLATDFVGMPEHVAGGELVKVAGVFRPPERPQVIKAVPDAGSIAAGLEKILNTGREAYSKKGRAFAEAHSWDRCLEKWRTVLADCEREIDRRTLIPPVPARGLASLAVASA